jgi:hypothetical protein
MYHRTIYFYVTSNVMYNIESTRHNYHSFRFMISSRHCDCGCEHSYAYVSRKSTGMRRIYVYIYNRQFTISNIETNYELHIFFQS